MAKEIERKFRVSGDPWRGRGNGVRIRQGYLSTVKERTVRVRIKGDHAYLTIKGVSVGAVRSEYEYEIPLGDADQMLDSLCERPIIEKIRYEIRHEGFTWEIDVFEGDNAGLVVAEIELADEHQMFPRPDWLGQEVTEDPRYFNANLIAHPYRDW